LCILWPPRARFQSAEISCMTVLQVDDMRSGDSIGELQAYVTKFFVAD